MMNYDPRQIPKRRTPQEMAPWNPINRPVGPYQQPPHVPGQPWSVYGGDPGEDWDRRYGSYTGADKKAYWEKQRMLRQGGRPNFGMPENEGPVDPGMNVPWMPPGDDRPSTKPPPDFSGLLDIPQDRTRRRSQLGSFMDYIKDGRGGVPY